MNIDNRYQNFISHQDIYVDIHFCVINSIDFFFPTAFCFDAINSLINNY